MSLDGNGRWHVREHPRTTRPCDTGPISSNCLCPPAPPLLAIPWNTLFYGEAKREKLSKQLGGERFTSWQALDPTKQGTCSH